MKSDYDKFFKAAKSSKKSSPPVNTKKAGKPISAEEYLRKALNVKDSPTKKSRSNFPLFSIMTFVSICAFSLYAYLKPNTLKDLYERTEIALFSSSLAEEAPKTPEKNAEPKSEGAAENSADPKKAEAAACTEVKGFTEEELSHFNKLNERKKELDQREHELSVLEEELHKQKAEIEVRITKLEQIREEVATVLKDRVEVDQQRVNTLVDFYSNMKPKQAAEVFAKLNEDLAVEVLGKMKKKNAADILNLLEPVKARALSEKFTGYTRR